MKTAILSSKIHTFVCLAGITPDEYDAAVARGTGLQFVCLRCRHNDTDENGDLLNINDSPWR